MGAGLSPGWLHLGRTRDLCAPSICPEPLAGPGTPHAERRNEAGLAHARMRGGGIW